MTKCKHCTPAKGLPILPTRYIIAPKMKEDETLLPSWAQSAQTSMISDKLSEQSQLALRVMGKGYLYVLLKMQDSAQLNWRVYSIDENGGFWRQHNVEKYGIASASESTALIGCEAGEHQSSDVAFITIEQAEKCETAWLAYSRFKWNEEICEQYSDLSNEQIRNERMQKIEPAKWLNSQVEGDGVAKAIENNINQVLGYQSPYNETIYRYTKFTFFDTNSAKESPNYGVLSTSDKDEVFLVDMEKFKKRSTSHHWNQEFNKVDSEQKPLLLSSVIESSKENASIEPMIVGLWDTISIVEDIKLWFNQATANIQQIELEREREIGLANTFQFIGKAIESGTAEEYTIGLDKHFMNRLKSVNGQGRRELNDVISGPGKLNEFELANAEYWERVFRGNEIELLEAIQANVSHALDEKLISEQNLKSTSDPQIGVRKEDISYNTTIESKRQQQPQNIKYLQYDASYLYQWASRNINESKVFKPYDETLFLPIMRLESGAEANFSQLNKEFDLFKQKALAQGIIDKPIIDGLRVVKQQEEWQKYSQHISEERVQQFNTSYDRYQQNADYYMTLLINDFTVMVDARESKLHPFYYANEEYLTLSKEYLAFIDDILLTLNNEITIIRAAKAKPNNSTQKQYATKQTSAQQDYSAADLAKIGAFKDKESLVYQLISKPELESSNLFWAAILAGKSLTKEQQSRVISFIGFAYTDNKKEINQDNANSVIDDMSAIFNIPPIDFDTQSVESIKNLVEQVSKEFDPKMSQQEVKNATLNAPDTSGDTMIDTTKDTIEKAVDTYQSTAEYQQTPSVTNTSSIESEALLNLLKTGQEKISGLFASVTNYMHDKGFTFNSRYGNALYSAVCFGMKISANIVKSLITSFIKFSDDLLKAIAKKMKMAADIVNSAYSKLSDKLQSGYKSHNLKLPITRCLLGFQLFSIYRTWQSATSDKDKMTTAEMTSLWSGIMSAAMLTTKSFRCAAFVSKIVEKIKTKAFGATLSDSAKFKLLRHSAAGIMRVGNILGAIGSLLGALSQVEKKESSSAGSVMKWVNIFNSILLTIDFVCQAFVKQTLAKLLLRYAASSVICAFLGRLVSFMLHPLVGLAIFIITTVVALLSDNPLQSWFKSNRMGRNYYVWDNNRTFGYTLTNYSWAYGSYQDELNDLHEILDTDEYKAEQERKKNTATKALQDTIKETNDKMWENIALTL